MAQTGVQARDDTQPGETGVMQASKAVAAEVDPVEADMPDSTSPGVAVSRCEPSDPSRMEHEQTVVSETDMEGRMAASSSPQQDSPGGLAQDCESITSALLCTSTGPSNAQTNDFKTTFVRFLIIDFCLQ